MTIMIRKLLAGAAALALIVSASVGASADAFFTNPETPLLYPYTPLSPGQHNLAPTSATGLTIPTSAWFATVCASTATVRYTTDGTTTPTSTVGQPLASGVCVGLSGPLVLANFKAFSSTGTLDIEYFK